MFLIRVLLPLHKVKSLSVYHPQVSRLPPDGPCLTAEREGKVFQLGWGWQKEWVG